MRSQRSSASSHDIKNHYDNARTVWMAIICPKLQSLNRSLKKFLFQKIHFDVNFGQNQRRNEFFEIGIFLGTDLGIAI
jgi:hypothetical protein